MTLRIVAFAVASGIAAPALAQPTGASDSFALARSVQPQGPVTPAYLRLHHPLYLLDLCRQVKAGARDPQTVAPLVGGQPVLNALLARDLDTLFDTLTMPQDATAAGGASLWSRILTQDGAAQAPDPGPIDVRLSDVQPRAAASQSFRATALADGVLLAQVPDGSALQILSMKTLSGIVSKIDPAPGTVPAALVELATAFSTFGLGVPPAGSALFVAAETTRVQGPWSVPVQAGQDVEIEVGFPPTAPVPSAGASTTIQLSDGSGALWLQNVNVVAQPALPLDPLFVAVSASQKFFDVVEWTGPVCGTVAPAMLVPLTLSNPFPALGGKGTVTLASGPQGLSIAPVGFTFQPGGTVSLALQVFITFCSASDQREVAQPFSVKVSYQTVPLTASGSQTVTFHYTTHEDSQAWPTAAGKAGGVDCAQNVVLYASGAVLRSGDCANDNFYNANVLEDIFIGSWRPFPPHGDVYLLGFFNTQQHFFSIQQSLAQTNYIWLRNQPLTVVWTKY